MKTHFTSLIVLTIGTLLSCSTSDHSLTTLSLEEYTNTLNRVVTIDTAASSAATKYATAREAILGEANNYRSQWNELRNLSVPAAVSSAHSDFANALNEQYESNLDAAQHTPEGLAATQENVNQFAHYRADVGYARDDQSKAGCQLQSILSQSNLSFHAAGVCSAAGEMKVPDKAAGTKQQPVSDVYILHDAIKEANGTIIRPNVDGFAINTIYAKANQPLTVTFDNKNPEPFVFSFSIYKGSDTRLKSADFVAGTEPYSGIRVHKLTVTLAAGTYTYVDNVHPIAMRGTLVVVD